MMRALWALKKATVAQIVQTIPTPRLAHTTVSTVLGVLESKRVVRRDPSRKAHEFVPLIDRSAAEGAAIGDLVHSFFDNNRQALALRLLSEERIPESQLRQIRNLLEQAEKKK